MCRHSPRCSNAHDPACCMAHVTADHTEQGWHLLRNGHRLFDDGHYIDPDGNISAVATH